MKNLTLEIANKLIGKRIQTHYCGYMGQDWSDNFIIGELISEYEFAKRNKNFSGFSDQSVYWDSYMNNQKLKEKKHTLKIITSDGRDTYIFCDYYEQNMNNPSFTCSDSDRYVSFEIVD